MLKRFKLPQKKAHIAFVCLTLLTTLSCGKRKPPLPPFERVSQRVEVAGLQRGEKVTLRWMLPARNASDKSVLTISRVDIYRLAEPLSEPLTLTEEEFASRSTLIATLPITESDFAKRQFTFTDTLEFTVQAARLRYAVRLVNDAGQKASFSNYFLIEPTSRVADNPKNLSVKLTEKSVLLRWEKPIANVDNSQPANILGYNIYRAKESGESSLLNSTVVNDVEYSDIFFDFGITYRYFVRVVSLGAGSEPIESSDSNVVEILPRDIFAPSPPSAVTIAAAPNNLSIFFAVNPESDISGYRIFRSTNSAQPKSKWQLLNSELLLTNTFQDTKVESGKTYFYYLTAVDKAGNISQPSEVFSEIAP